MKDECRIREIRQPITGTHTCKGRSVWFYSACGDAKKQNFHFLRPCNWLPTSFSGDVSEMSAYEEWAPKERITMHTLRRWKVREFVKPTATPWLVTIRHDVLQRLILGYFAMDMDQKWIFLTLGPDEEGIYTVRMLRSWTGRPMMSMKIKAELDEQNEPISGRNAQIFELEWETEEEIWPLEDFLPNKEKAKEWTREICQWVMEIDLPQEAGVDG